MITNNQGIKDIISNIGTLQDCVIAIHALAEDLLFLLLFLSFAFSTITFLLLSFTFLLPSRLLAPFIITKYFHPDAFSP